MNKIFESFQAMPGASISLKKFSTKAPKGFDKAESLEKLEEVKEKLADHQERLYAENKTAVLIVFQAMDAAGKDSIIAHVMSGLNPQGTQVYSFKQPNDQEYDHDFLWRHYAALPERGRIGIHNRSHYENVLVCKVHPEYVLKEHIPTIDSVKKVNDKFWKKRYESIRNFEQHLVENGVVILKFFLHVSKAEQKERFLERIEEPSKNWKFSFGDLAERKLWPAYQKAYEQAISETSTKDAPWYIIPADQKWFTRLAVSKIIENTLDSLRSRYPKLSDEKVAELAKAKALLISEI